jgi:hypothetical protein
VYTIYIETAEQDMAKQQCRLKGYSKKPANKHKPLVLPNKDILTAFLVVFLVSGLALFLLHLWRKAPNTNIWGFPIRANRPEMGMR